MIEHVLSSMDPVRAFPSVHGVCEMFAADHTNQTLFDFKKQYAFYESILFSKKCQTLLDPIWKSATPNVEQCLATAEIHRLPLQSLVLSVLRSVPAKTSASRHTAAGSHWRDPADFMAPPTSQKMHTTAIEEQKGPWKKWVCLKLGTQKFDLSHDFPLWTCYFRATPHFQANPPKKKHSSGEVSTASVQIIST